MFNQRDRSESRMDGGKPTPRGAGLQPVIAVMVKWT